MAHPVTLAAAIALTWQPPSNESYAAFYSHNSESASKVVEQDVAAFNRCIDNCKKMQCAQFDIRTGECVYKSRDCAAMTKLCTAEDYRNLISDTGVGASFKRYMNCAPRRCTQMLAKYWFPVPKAMHPVGLNLRSISKHDQGGPPILDSMRHVKFYGTQLVASISGFNEWNASQAVPNIVSACKLFGTYDNVSMSMYTWGYSLSSNQGTLTADSIVQLRYPRAAEIMGTAIRLKNKGDLCSVFDELIDQPVDKHSYFENRASFNMDDEYY